jgi:hypothetical protein
MRRKKISGGADYVIPVAIVVAVGVGIYYLWNELFGGSGSGSGSGPGKAVTTAINNLAASSPLPQQVASLQTVTALDNWYNSQTDATNPFLPTLFDTGNDCSVLADNVAQDLWAVLYNASNAEAFFKPEPDLSGILTQWQAYVQNQCDVSFIASNCQQQTNDTLWIFMEKYFLDDETRSSGQTNVAMFWQLVQWVSSLPQTS